MTPTRSSFSSNAIRLALSTTVVAMTPLLGGCGLAIKEGAQHAHFLPETKLEVQTVMQLDMLPEPLHAKACAEPKTMYDVTVLGTEKSLSRGERAAALEALNTMEGKADVFYLTRSWGSLDDSGKSCGEVWGRGIRLRLRDAAPPVARPNTEVTAVAVPVGVPAAAPTPPAPSTPAAPGDKAKMGF
jgi:hypothetical protein